MSATEATDNVSNVNTKLNDFLEESFYQELYTTGCQYSVGQLVKSKIIPFERLIKLSQITLEQSLLVYRFSLEYYDFSQHIVDNVPYHEHESYTDNHYIVYVTTAQRKILNYEFKNDKAIPNNLLNFYLGWKTYNIEDVQRIMNNYHLLIIHQHPILEHSGIIVTLADRCLNLLINNGYIKILATYSEFKDKIFDLIIINGRKMLNTAFWTRIMKDYYWDILKYFNLNNYNISAMNKLSLLYPTEYPDFKLFNNPLVEKLLNMSDLAITYFLGFDINTCQVGPKNLIKRLLYINEHGHENYIKILKENNRKWLDLQIITIKAAYMDEDCTVFDSEYDHIMMDDLVEYFTSDLIVFNHHGKIYIFSYMAFQNLLEKKINPFNREKLSDMFIFKLKSIIDEHNDKKLLGDTIEDSYHKILEGTYFPSLIKKRFIPDSLWYSEIPLGQDLEHIRQLQDVIPVHREGRRVLSQYDENIMGEIDNQAFIRFFSLYLQSETSIMEEGIIGGMINNDNNTLSYPIPQLHMTNDSMRIVASDTDSVMYVTENRSNSIPQSRTNDPMYNFNLSNSITDIPDSILDPDERNRSNNPLLDSITIGRPFDSEDNYDSDDSDYSEELSDLEMPE